jgi:hypothetical protein
VADTGLRDRIRRRYKKGGLDSVWNFLMDGRNSCIKSKRFNAAAVWARLKRNNQKKDSNAWKIWEHRRGVYHRKSVYYAEKCAKRQQNNTPKTGCGDCGYPEWGGGRSIAEREAVPVLLNHGAPISSRKRTVTLGNPSSDHSVGNTCAYAVDAATFSGADDARAVAAKLGISGYSTGNYNAYYITRCGRRFRVQILWAVSGHYDHVHVGFRRL